MYPKHRTVVRALIVGYDQFGNPLTLDVVQFEIIALESSGIMRGPIRGYSLPGRHHDERPFARTH